jgi:molybdopterin synthase sulfur carrier subunit
MPTVKLFASRRNAAGIKEASIRRTSVGEMVLELVTRYPALAGQLIENGQLRPHVIITINGHHTNNIEMSVTEQDEMAIFPPIGGG